VARLHYHEWSPNENFASSELVDENRWMASVLRGLDTKWKKKKLVWMNLPGTEPREFMKLAREYVPSVLHLTQAFYIRELPGVCEEGIRKFTNPLVVLKSARLAGFNT